MNHIKVNLPDSAEAYRSGNGEGVFVIVDEEAKRAYDTDEAGTVYGGILDNDSIYYPGLTHGTSINFEMRGENRPVVSFDWLREYYGEPVE